jgi:hypothetical protein
MMDAHPSTEPIMRSRLAQVLHLARMTLFELDISIMQYACLAHTHALTTMWRVRQPAAAVVLVRYALHTHLTNQVTQRHRKWHAVLVLCWVVHCACLCCAMCIACAMHRTSDRAGHAATS